jgi:hypothetical protein
MQDMPYCASERKPETDWPAVLDAARALLAMAGLTLIPLDAYCATCGCDPCVNIDFCRAFENNGDAARRSPHHRRGASRGKARQEGQVERRHAVPPTLLARADEVIE